MISIKGFISLPKAQRKFIEEYLEMISSFQFDIETYRGEQNNLAIQNTDLWIESYIELMPELQEFRNLVRSEMNRLEIKKHPLYTYDKKFNHYYYSNIKKIEELKNSLIINKKEAEA